jgi:hypothetical protein
LARAMRRSTRALVAPNCKAFHMDHYANNRTLRAAN